MQIIKIIFKFNYNTYMDKGHYVYMLLTKYETLYCGYTDDIDKRFNMHTQGKGAKYTKAFKPLKIVYLHSFETKSEAMKEEYRIKHKLTRAQKLALIDSEQNQV